ncbi:LMF2 [Blepharisma stoltei]|uniref:Lipase maturation factor 2 n=1 Tax=Blepharisma stoltei TaxID=1481888 RepID=A0AAU9K5X5_9CILI|nr:unnamed protein product [Blepharisma stoltei]
MDLEITIQRGLVTKIFAFCYLSAFISNYVQIAGLWGSDGILPAKIVVDHATANNYHLPFLYWDSLHILDFLKSIFPILLDFSDTDTTMYIICMIGIIFSNLCLFTNRFNNAVSFMVLWVCFYTFFSIGRTFLSFQWDILIIESGFLMIFYARIPIFQSAESTSFIQLFAREMLRWLSFRYIFSSGNVKLLSECPTWWNLSALFYHYETQCLPTPFSWYFHQLPHIIQRLSVGFAYFSMIFTSILYYSPLRYLRIFGVLMQFLAQILILASGNYNFFNILTIGLLIAMLDDYFLLNFKWLIKFLGKILGFPVIELKVKREKHWILHHLSWILFSTLIIYFFLNPNTLMKGKLDWTLSQQRKILNHPYFLYALSLVPIFIIINTGRYLIHHLKQIPLSIPPLLILIIIYCSSLSPFLLGIDSNYKGLILPTPMIIEKSYEWTSPYQLTNSYGLFRRMTGVGGRPELIIQGSYDQKAWKDYEFTYKPQNITLSPKINIPHQPRLDWQMWFAALGDLRNSPWMVALLNRLFYSSPSVNTLLEKNPFEENPPNYIRIQMYNYNFTTYEGHEWKNGKETFIEGLSNAILKNKPKNWWKRKYIRDWLPSKSINDTLLTNNWKQWGYPNPNNIKKSIPSIHPMHYVPVFGISLGFGISLIISRLLIKSKSLKI